MCSNTIKMPQQEDKSRQPRQTGVDTDTSSYFYTPSSNYPYEEPEISMNSNASRGRLFVPDLEGAQAAENDEWNNFIDIDDSFRGEANDATKAAAALNPDQSSASDHFVPFLDRGDNHRVPMMEQNYADCSIVEAKTCEPAETPSFIPESVKIKNLLGLPEQDDMRKKSNYGMMSRNTELKLRRLVKREQEEPIKQMQQQRNFKLISSSEEDTSNNDKVVGGTSRREKNSSGSRSSHWVGNIISEYESNTISEEDVRSSISDDDSSMDLMELVLEAKSKRAGKKEMHSTTSTEIPSHIKKELQEAASMEKRSQRRLSTILSVDDDNDCSRDEEELEESNWDMNILIEGEYYLAISMLVYIYALLRETSMLGHTDITYDEIDVNSFQSEVGFGRSCAYLSKTKSAGFIIRVVMDELEKKGAFASAGKNENDVR